MTNVSGNGIIFLKRLDAIRLLCRIPAYRIYNEALDWLCDETFSILDFDCGNGTLLFLCALRGTKRHVGIDLSAAGIRAAKQSAGRYFFLHTGIEYLHKIEDAFFDAVILSNILDNLAPENAQTLIGESYCVLKPDGFWLSLIRT